AWVWVGSPGPAVLAEGGLAALRAVLRRPLTLFRSVADRRGTAGRRACTLILAQWQHRPAHLRSSSAWASCSWTWSRRRRAPAWRRRARTCGPPAALPRTWPWRRRGWERGAPWWRPSATTR